jgi:hypothetical protein
MSVRNIYADGKNYGLKLIANQLIIFCFLVIQLMTDVTDMHAGPI